MRYCHGRIWKIQAVAGGQGITDSEEVRKSAMWLSVGGVFQTEATINAKAYKETTPGALKEQQRPMVASGEGVMRTVREDEAGEVKGGWRGQIIEGLEDIVGM